MIIITTTTNGSSSCRVRKGMYFGASCRQGLACVTRLQHFYSDTTRRDKCVGKQTQ
jgi:hypothetical protein